MRGADAQTGALFSYLSPDALVPRDHPLRAIQQLVNAALEKLSPRFSKLYATGGRDSIAPEKLLRALLLQAFYGVRSERQLMEQITYMLFRWFLGLSMDACLGRDRIHQEPGAIAGGQHRHRVPDGGDKRSGHQGAPLERAFFGRWHAD